MLFQHESVSGTESPASGEESYRKKCTYILLNTGSYAIDPWDLVPSLTWSGLVSDFLKGTVNPISFLCSLWHFTGLNRQSPPMASEEVEQAFCWRSCLPCHRKWCAKHTAVAGKLGISLHGFLWVPPCRPAGHHFSCFSIILTEVCFTPRCHFSLSYNFVPQIQTLDCEPNCALKSVGYHCPQKDVFCSAEEKLTWKEKREQKSITQDYHTVSFHWPWCPGALHPLIHHHQPKATFSLCSGLQWMFSLSCHPHIYILISLHIQWASPHWASQQFGPWEYPAVAGQP